MVRVRSRAKAAATLLSLLSLCGAMMLGQGHAVAHELLKNTASLLKSGPKTIALSFQLDPSATLHRALKPEMPFDAFLARYADMPMAEFQVELTKAQTALARDIRINGPDGKKMALNSWKWQDAQTWKDMLRAQLLISLATPNELGHLQQTAASAQAISPRPISHVQVSLPRAMNPILVRSSPTDAFWLTDQIPQAIVTYE